MKNVDGGLCAPQGFRASGVTAHIKNLDSTKKDCALVVSDSPASLAGMFTTNRVKAPPVAWNEQRRSHGLAQAVFINSGNANACTGETGTKNVATTAKWVADALDVAPEMVCVASTGVIGVQLPMERIHEGVSDCVVALSEAGSAHAAAAIMTTDTVPKEMAVEVALSTGAARLGAIAKGSGMIAPNMATMIAVITTDAAVMADALQPLLAQCVQQSFNCICVDNDMSTSDTVLCLANGQAGNTPLVPGSPDYDLFAAALEELCVAMAKALVKDGEGASKFIEIQVEGADTNEAAKTIARSIAQSQLCKTAFFGEDPNWGRFACAAGYAGIPFDVSDLTIWINDLAVVEKGLPTDFEEGSAAAYMQAPEFTIRVSVGAGTGAAVFWTSDLSHDYVTINADYRT
jgi:glutamate N-acetyltransferase / amino-acid N-acetyltransferase